METKTITIRVTPDAARAYELAGPDDRRRLEALLSLKLSEIRRSRKSLEEIMAEVDLLHLAISVVHEMVYLLTWNCRHLANGVVIRNLQAANLLLGHPTPIILTPEELLERPEE